MILDWLTGRRDISITNINDPRQPLYQALTGWLDGPTISSGVTVNQQTAMRVITVNACVKLIAESIAALPLQTFNRGDDGRTPIRVPRESYVWDQPNPEMTPMEFWEQLFGSLLLDGNAFAEKVQNRAGQIVELWPIEPLGVEVEYDSDGRKVFTIGSRTYDSRTIWHVPAFRRPQMPRGMSPIAAAREGVGLSIASERLAAKFFGQGSVLSGLINVEADLSGKPEVVQALIAGWNHAHAGTNNAYSVGVLDNSASFTQLSIPPEDLQFMEARKFQVVEICRLYQVPPHMVADVERSTSWGTGIEQQGIQFVTYSLLRWVRRTEQSISKFLLPTRERYARWNLDALLRGDSVARGGFYAQGRQGGWLSINDIRRLEEMPPIPGPGGDDYLMPLNYIPVDEVPASNGQSANGLRDVLSRASQS